MNQTAIMSPEQVAIEDVKRLANIVLGLRDQVFKIDLDYGVIPGTGNKPTLLLPGMEKLMRALHLRAEYVEKSKIEDFDKPLIYYRYECRLIDYETGVCISTAIGSANSHEGKWRWRDQKRTCPKCGKETINRSKFPPKNDPNAEPGWYCYGKIGGCGVEYSAKDPAIINQPVGRVENPDILDQMNTIDKIAQKRALGSAIKGAANVSEFFTVDLEDFVPYDTSNVVDGTYTVVKSGQTSTGHESDTVRVEQPSAKVVGVRPTPPPASVAADHAPNGASNDPLAQFGMEQGATAVPIVNHPDDDPNLYRAVKLAVGGSRTRKTYEVWTETNINIPLKLEHVQGRSIDGEAITTMTAGIRDLNPYWSVWADHDADGWHVTKIETGIPVNGVSE